MEITDVAFIALVVSIVIYILNDDSDGGRRGRLPVSAAY